MTTIRTTLGERTLFDGVSCVRAGQVLTFDLSGDQPRLSRRGSVPAPRAVAHGPEVREAVEDSVVRHLVSDVPTSCLLSGGLDSSIIAGIARKHDPGLHTYCSGAVGVPAIDGAPESDDFTFARQAALHLGVTHAEVPVTRAGFAERWPEMVGALGMPLSTPNEVAIYEVARRIRADGRIVTLSGEGADELFGGYDLPLSEAAAFAAGNPTVDATARFLLDSGAWVPTGVKPSILQPGVWRALEKDEALVGVYADEFSSALADGDDPHPLQAHLRFQRRVNLTGLLSRLDSATMLAGVEGRTPLADSAIASLAEALPMNRKFIPAGAGSAARTKIALREAFSDSLPLGILARPKASFPLPFQEWVGDNAAILRAGGFIRSIFTDAAIDAVVANPRGLWRVAWPMVNIALWGRRWWG